MDLVENWEGWRSRIDAVRKGAPAYTTNLFASDAELSKWCNAGKVRVITTTGALLVAVADRDFHHLYHAARDQASLRCALKSLPPGVYTTDIIEREDAASEVVESYRSAGFHAHVFLRRMVLNGAPPQMARGFTEAAEREDAAEIHRLLTQLLDPLSEQIPDEQEIGEAVAAGQLLLVRRSGVIAGILMYELKGRLAHLRFWHVAPEARGEGVGRRLMSDFLIRCADARRIVLWVIGDNARSIAIYQHYGFAGDGLLDRVMTLQKENYQ